MKILIVHKFLHYVGGVETYVRWLSHALTTAGHEVGFVGMAPPAATALMDLPDGPRWLTPTRSYHGGLTGRVSGAAASLWSPAAGRTLTQAVRTFRPDVVHFHGTCYQLTPSVVQAAVGSHVPLVLTAHEYKLACANQTLFNDVTGEICTACVGAGRVTKLLAPTMRSCMKGSRAVSALGALEGQISRPVWNRSQAMVLAPSEFMRSQLIRDGWPADRVRYLDLPWRRDDQYAAPPPDLAPDRVVFLSRMVPLKGPDRLLMAWREVAPEFPQVRLRMLGEGSQRSQLEEMVAQDQIPRVDFLGHCEHEQVTAELERALVTVHPSQCHENSPFSVRESLMAGVPAIVSQVGGMPEMVGRESGWVVPPRDHAALVCALREAISDPRTGAAELRREVNARAVSETRHLAQLEAAYRGTEFTERIISLRDAEIAAESRVE